MSTRHETQDDTAVHPSSAYTVVMMTTSHSKRGGLFTKHQVPTKRSKSTINTSISRLLTPNANKSPNDDRLEKILQKILVENYRISVSDNALNEYELSN